MSIDTEIDKKQESNISSQNELCVSIENSITKSEIEDNKEKISEYLELFLNSDLSYTNPKQYYIDDTLFDNKFGTWRGLFTNIVSYLANKDPKKFIQYAEIINTKSIDNYYFSKNSLPDKDVIFIKAINQYVVFHGNASFIGKQLFELLRFFGYSDKYKIYGVKRDSSKEYQAKNHPLEKQNIDTFDDILDIIEIYNEKVENDFKEKIKTCSCFEPLIKYVKKKCIEEKNFEFLSEKLDNSIAYINFKTKRGIRDFAICEFFDEETEEKINKYIKDNDLDCIHVRCIIKTHEPDNEFISISEVPKDKLTIFFEKPFLCSTTIKILRIEE